MVAKADSFRHSVFALCMVSEQFCATTVSMVQPRYFEVPAEQHLCRFIIEHFREFKKPPNKVVLRDRAIKYFNSAKHLQGHLEEFDVLLDIVCDMEAQAAEQYDYMKSSLIDYCRQQAITAAIISSVDSIQKGKVDQIMPAIQAALMVGADSGGKGIFLLEDSDKRQNAQQTRDVVPTGYAFMDEPLKGGLAKKELAIIMAPPNTGKTSVLINLGVGIMKNRKKVAHFSLEMDQGIVRAKYDQCFLKKTDSQLLLDQEGNAALAVWMKNVKKQLMGADIYIKDYPAHRLSLEMLKAHLLLLKSQYGFVPDAVMLDYLDIMQHPTHIKEESSARCTRAAASHEDDILAKGGGKIFFL